MNISPAFARGIRTLLQGLVAAAGTISLDKLVNGLDPQVIGALQIILTWMISYAHNALEDSGAIPVVLKPAPVPEGEPVTGEVAPIPADKP